MYTLGVDAVCVGLIFLFGAALFAVCVALLVVKDVYRVLVDMTSMILVRVRFSAARAALAVRPLPHFKSSYRRGWAGVIVSHRAVPARSLMRMR